MSKISFPVRAIDAVVNIQTDEALSYRPEDRQGFYMDKIGVDNETYKGVSLNEMLRRMDSAGIEKAFLVAPKIGRKGLAGSYSIPYQLIVEALKEFPDRFYGLAGIDPYTGMDGVKEFESAITELGFIGAHVYPHWFELAPDHAKYYPFYAKCVELGVPIQMQVGQSLIYSPNNPMRSVGQPITIDTVACDFPELKIIGIHIGVPWHDEMIAMAWKHPNVYIGCDAHAPKYWPKSFVEYINSYGQDKVIFGTDFPIIDFSRAMKEIGELKFKSTSLAKLLRYNVERIYSLKC